MGNRINIYISAELRDAINARPDINASAVFTAAMQEALKAPAPQRRDIINVVSRPWLKHQPQQPRYEPDARTPAEKAAAWAEGVRNSAAPPPLVQGEHETTADFVKRAGGATFRAGERYDGPTIGRELAEAAAEDVRKRAQTTKEALLVGQSFVLPPAQFNIVEVGKLSEPIDDKRFTTMAIEGGGMRVWRVK
jgi:hypothetical protein